MKLINLEVNNFRQFYGTQSIAFSSDNKKNITLIHGENNSGKTTLLNAIRWCLHEKTTANFSNPKQLLNIQAKEEGKSVFSVTLKLEYEGTIYSIRRAGSTHERPELSVYTIQNGVFSPRLNNPQSRINNLLPEDMAQYFFYQGEGDGALNEANNFEFIEASIKRVLGFTVAEEAIRHLNIVKNEYTNQFRQYHADDDLAIALTNKQRLEREINDYDKQLNNLNHQKTLTNKKLEQLFEHQYNLDSVNIERKIKEKNRAEQHRRNLERMLYQLNEEKKAKLKNWLENTYLNKLSNFDLSIINIDILKTKTKYTVDKNLVRSIIKNAECICGGPVTKDSSAQKLLNELLENSVDQAIASRWNKVIHLQERLGQRKPQDIMSEILVHEERLENTLTTISEQETLITELSHEIRQFNIDEIDHIEDQIRDTKRKLGEYTHKLTTLEHHFETRKRELENIKKEISTLESKAPHADNFINLIKATEAILNLFHNELKESQKEVNVTILSLMRKLFDKVSHNGFTVAQANNDWIIVDKENRPVNAGNGYRAMLAISFIVSLIQFSAIRKNAKNYLLTPGTVAPFIADSILAFIDPDNGRELVKFISESVEQVVFFLSQAQWTNNIDRGIRDKIGAEYNLVEHTKLTREEFKGTYPTSLTINGKEYDVVKFGAEFNHVRIEKIS